MENYINLKVSDGTTMECYVSMPNGVVGKTNPSLILLQEAFGVNHHIRDVADRFAAQGFIVIAPEMYHRTAPPYFEASYDDFDAVKPHSTSMTIEGNAADIKAAFRWLSHHDLVNPSNIFSIG